MKKDDNYKYGDRYIQRIKMNVINNNEYDVYTFVG